MVGASKVELETYAKQVAAVVSTQATDTANARSVAEAVALYPIAHAEKIYVIARLPAHGVKQDVANTATLMLGPETKKEWPLWAQIVAWGVGLVVVEEAVRFVFFRREE